MTTYNPILARQATLLSRDIYLPREKLQAQYPSAAIIEAACDRCLILKQDNLLWVVFMGTHNLASLLSDFDVKRKPACLCVSGNIPGQWHAGFATGLTALWPSITQILSNKFTSSDQLIITGHSRGGSQAEMFAAAWLQNIGPVAAVLPIAPARPGDAAFRDWYNPRLGDKTFFLHHGADIVPWEGPWLAGHRHVGHRVWFPEKTLLPIPPIIDPPLWAMAASCVLSTWNGWRKTPPQIQQLQDHHIDTYVKLLSGEWGVQSAEFKTPHSELPTSHSQLPT